MATLTAEQKEMRKAEAAAAVSSAQEEKAKEMAAQGITKEVLKTREEMTGALKADVQGWADLQGKSTELLKLMADHMVAFRSTFRIVVKGKTYPDWAARSGETRAAIGKVYEAAGLKGGDEQKKLTDALRYHIGNALRPAMVKHYRTKAKAEEVMGILGLGTATPKERIGATQGRAATGAGGTATAAVGKVSIPGVSVSEAVGSLAAAVAKSMAQTDALGCVREASSVLSTARAFGIPEEKEDREALSEALSALVTVAQAWAGEIALYVPPVAVLVTAGTEGAQIPAA